MLNLIQNQRKAIEAHRKQENGYSFVEVMVTILLISIVSIMTLNAVVVSTRTASSFVQYSEGVNQGVTNDAVRSAFKSAKEFHADYPDIPVTNQNLETYGYLPTDIPNTVHWGVGQESRWTNNTGNQICAVAFSLTEDDGQFTETQPVEINAHMQGVGLLSPGCWGTVNEGMEYDPATDTEKPILTEKHVANGLNEIGVKQENQMVWAR